MISTQTATEARLALIDELRGVLDRLDHMRDGPPGGAERYQLDQAARAVQLAIVELCEP